MQFQCLKLPLRNICFKSERSKANDCTLRVLFNFQNWLVAELGVVTKVKIEEYRDNSDLRSDYEDYAPDRSYSHWLTNPDECWVSWTYEYTVEYYRDYSLVEANRASMEDSDYDYEYDYEYVPYQKRYLTVDAWQTYRMQLSVVHRIQILTCIHDG